MAFFELQILVRMAFFELQILVRQTLNAFLTRIYTKKCNRRLIKKIVFNKTKKQTRKT